MGMTPIHPPSHSEVVVNKPGLRIQGLEGETPPETPPQEAQQGEEDLDAQISQIAEGSPEPSATEKLREHMKQLETQQEESATAEDPPSPPPPAAETQEEVPVPAPAAQAQQEEDDGPSIVVKESRPAGPSGIEEKDIGAAAVSIDDSMIFPSTDGVTLESAVARFANRNVKSPGFQVLALHTGFSTELTSLSFREINALQASLTDNYTQRYKMIQTVYNRMRNTTVNMTFDQFLKDTAYTDLNTLLYGLYAATYPDKHEFKAVCQNPECRKEVSFNRYPSDLVHNMKSKAVIRIKELLEAKKLDEARSENIVSRVERRELPESKVVVEIRNPTLKDYLNSTQRHMQEEKRSKDDTNAALITIQMYLKKLFMPGTAVGEVGQKYLPITNPAHVMNIVSSLGPKDGDALMKAIVFESGKYDVEYCLPDYSCPHCSFDNPKTPINFEEILFFEMTR